MEKIIENSSSPAYQIGNTLYQVTSVFQNTEQTENLAKKIERLILRDQENKNAPA